MITIINKITRIPVNNKQLKKNTNLLLDALGYKGFDISLLLTTNKTIKRYNTYYREMNAITDILSFPYYEIKPGEVIIPLDNEDKNLGDIIISLEQAQKDAHDLRIPLQEYLSRLLVHGICHLLGYEHETEKDYKIMKRQELSLLKHLKN